jgi:hypothetical protein
MPTTTLSRRRATAARPETAEGESAITQASRCLRHSFAAARISFTWLGVRKTLSPEQKEQAAESFGSHGQFLSAAKKLLDTRDEKYRRVTAVRSRIQSYWKALSLPYPEPGIRLIRQDSIEPFDRQLTGFREELTEAVADLDNHFDALKAAARDRLGSLYDPADYPPTLRGLFEVSWDFPSVEPPDYLLRLNPQLYQQEQARIAARFDEAVKLAEQAFIGEFSGLVSHLVERLSGAVDGEKKVFRDTAISNLTGFFQRFSNLSVRSNADLDRLVETAQQTLKGVEPDAVRNSDSLRQQVARQLSAVQSVLDGMLVDQPRRRILRPAVTSAVKEG